MIKIRTRIKRTGLDSTHLSFDLRNRKWGRISRFKGIIRVRIGKVPTGILETRIPVLNLEQRERFNPQMIITKIVYRTKEVEAAENFG